LNFQLSDVIIILVGSSTIKNLSIFEGEMMAIEAPYTTWQSLFDPGRYSPKLLGLLAIILNLVAWAIAANVANSLFLVGVQPFELAEASAMIATIVLVILDSFVERSYPKGMSRQQFALKTICVALHPLTFLRTPWALPR
jgi:predicted membrane protein